MADTRSLDGDSGDPATAPTKPSSEGEVRVAAGDCLGRYTVRALVGAGGMGEVYEGHDPELERAVALKVMKAGWAPEARARFQREAQAMARLNHPNVVAVYDVGTVGERVFVAMELVRGPTLAEWIGQGPHRWQEVVDVFLQAGRGLEAAHDAGIVHRDFKPRNVILGDRVRVADFGLARSFGDVETGGAPAGRLDDTVTQTGKALGTPAYMAPEQREGGAVTAQADQFAFCVALNEALAGTNPPRWLTALIARGRSVDPAQRFPSMRALLVELGRDRARTRRRILIGVGAAMLAAAVVAVRPAMNPCAGVAARLTEVWGLRQKDAVHAAFAAVGRPYAEDTFQRVRALLDDYAARWRDLAQETCRATRVQGVQSDSMMDLRMGCLERRRNQLGELVSLWTRGVDADGLEHAGDAALGLQPLAECADTGALSERAPLPAGATVRERIRRARAAIDEVRALTLAHRYLEAKTKAAPVRAEAEAIGWLPLRAEAAFAEAEPLYQLVAPDVESRLVEVAHLAGEAHDDRLQAQALVMLISHVAGDVQDAARALDFANVADGVVARAGEDRDLQAKLLRARGDAYRTAGKLDTARDAYVKARALFKDGEAGALAGDEALAKIAADQGHYDEARKLGEANLAATIALHGPEHPRVASMLVLLANSSARAGDLDVAADYYRRALAIMQKATPDAPPMAAVLDGLGAIELLRGHIADAAAAQERALAIEERALGPDTGQVSRTLQNLGLARRLQGRRDQAIGMFERALAINTRLYGADNQRLISPLVNLAQTWQLQGDSARALANYQRAVDVAAKSEGPTHPETLGMIGAEGLALARLHRCSEAQPLLASAAGGLEKAGVHNSDLAVALTGVALCQLDAGRAREAQATLEQAHAILDQGGAGPDDHGYARALQARVLWSLGRHAEARATARKAETELATTADGAEDLAALRAWIARR